MSEHNQHATIFRRGLNIGLLCGLAAFALALLLVPQRATAQLHDHGGGTNSTNLTIYATCTNSSYVLLHFNTLPSRYISIDYLNVYPTNAMMTNLTGAAWQTMWTTPFAFTTPYHQEYRDYSITNIASGSFRLYRLRAN